MSKRPNLSDRLAGAHGRQVFQPPAVHPGEDPGDRPTVDTATAPVDRPRSTVDDQRLTGDRAPSRVDGDRLRSAEDGQPSTGDSRWREPPGPELGRDDGSRGSWEASHRRVTFYCPLQLLDDIEREMSRSGRSKTSVIVDALAAHLAHPHAASS